MTEFAHSLADAAGQPQAALAALGQLAERVTGARLVTLMTLDPATGEGQRIWSNQTGPYPVGGKKPLDPGPWADRVVGARLPFVANSLPEIAAVFPDHALIDALGCGSCLNLPAIVAGQVLGTVNMLDAADYWTDQRLSVATAALALPAAAAFLLHRHLSQGQLP